jgi:hypothetical protein
LHPTVQRNEKKWATTHIHGGGTGSLSVSSSSVEHDQFSILQEDASRHNFRLRNANLQIAEGDDITVVTGTRVGDGRTGVLAVRNHSTGTSHIIGENLADLLSGSLDMVFDPVMRMVFSLLAAFVGLAGALGGIYSLTFGDLPLRGGLILLLGGAAIGWLGWRGATNRGRHLIEFRKALAKAIDST